VKSILNTIGNYCKTLDKFLIVLNVIIELMFVLIVKEINDVNFLDLLDHVVHNRSMFSLGSMHSFGYHLLLKSVCVFERLENVNVVFIEAFL